MKTSGKKYGKIVNNVLLVIFTFSALVAVYVAYDQYSQKVDLQEQYGFEKSNMEKYTHDSFQKIEDNLAQITSHEGQLQMNLDMKSADGTISQEERIQKEIKYIDGLIAENNKIINDLNSKVGTKDAEISKYRKKVKGLNGRLEIYKTQAAEMKKENELLTANIKDVSYKNAELSSENEQKLFQIDEQKKAIAQKVDEINTVYYVVGSFQELKEDQIVEKEGGLIGIGATKTLKNNFEKDKFVKIDKRNIRTIPISNKNAEIITKHNSDSYELVQEDGKVKWINIINPDLFWENSKYLVVVADDGWNMGLAEAK